MTKDTIPGLGTMLLLFVVLMAWGDTHFYFVHRLLHESTFLYRNVHKVHHESYNPNAWSGLSFHPVEAFLYFSGLMLVAVLPLPYCAFFGHKMGLLLFPANGHLGYELPLESGFVQAIIGDRHHYIHHTKFNYNYGSPSPFWDIVLGTEYNPTRGEIKGQKGTFDVDDARAAAARQQAREAGHEFSTDQAVEGAASGY